MYRIRTLREGDVQLIRSLLDVFGAAFDEEEVYCHKQPDDNYLGTLLANESFIALVAMDGDKVIGGIAAYELKKFEQARSEIYIYDLAVAEDYRRQGVATALIRNTAKLAREIGAHSTFVQADRNDRAPIALYSRLGAAEEVLHFDIRIDEPANQ
ncbi:AAC(3)-I family aminoglycoside N-acetyltransferase [Wenzhouxiangella sp. AB-CW3]|uniref:AAC(3)-I family aminoglycoside N-acetyltransferase n=1 Tax=Wenzhouxiangella sp. AB-CW3 TaxID=2771012 RepID=UPI00168AC6AD|nr:AAC(3)-I family aminoglycoside N-acetyltransferase [Wenzhouxiangella sp. AB-CW3]QOC22918.1 AAC(3)-I family aminoglycoside N-acetyltransferase [Wenzhouxiangella sp. AB-CW3]